MVAQTYKALNTIVHFKTVTFILCKFHINGKKKEFQGTTSGGNLSHKPWHLTGPTLPVGGHSPQVGL